VSDQRQERTSVLHAGGDAGTRRAVAAGLEEARDRFDAVTAASTSAARDRVGDVDCVVAVDGGGDGGDADWSDGDGALAVLEAVRDAAPDLPVVVVADPGDVAPATALERGGTDYCRLSGALDSPAVLARRVRNAVDRVPSERRRERREKAEQLEAVFEDLPLSLYLKDERARHVRVSRGHATGYDGSTPPEPDEGATIEGPEDFVGKTDLDLLPDVNAREPYEDDLRVIETGEPVRNKEEHIEREDGEDLWVTTTKIPWRDDGGEVRGLLGFSLDITERKRYEQRLEAQAERLELLTRLLRHDVAHEVSIVNQRATLLAERVPDPDARADIDAIRQSGERVAELLDTVQALVEAMLGEDSTVEPVPLAPPLRSELDRARSLHDDARVDGPETFPEVRVRANRMLREVFRNLLTNAVYHNDTDRPTVEVRVETDEEAVTVRVADDGPGVPAGQREAVFGRGEKGLESPGTGIGLYLVDTIVGKYDGEVWVEDNDPRGAVFCVRLARAD
jgi:signal transduction histidine kinase